MHPTNLTIVACFFVILAGETGTAVWKIPESRGSKLAVLPVEMGASLSGVPQQWKWYVVHLTYKVFERCKVISLPCRQRPN